MLLDIHNAFEVNRHDDRVDFTISNTLCNQHASLSLHVSNRGNRVRRQCSHTFRFLLSNINFGVLDLQLILSTNKVEQDQFSKDALLATGDRCLVEASPHDTIWGIGLTADDPRAWSKDTWLGKNLLGYTLNIVREIIKGKQDVTSNP